MKLKLEKESVRYCFSYEAPSEVVAALRELANIIESSEMFPEGGGLTVGLTQGKHELRATLVRTGPSDK